MGCTNVLSWKIKNFAPSTLPLYMWKNFNLGCSERFYEQSSNSLSSDSLSSNNLSPDSLSLDNLSPDSLSLDNLSPDSLSLELYKSWKLSSSVWLELLVDWDFSYVYGKNVQKKIFQLAKWKSSTKHLTNSHVSENLNLELFEQISAKKTWFQQSEPLFY